MNVAIVDSGGANLASLRFAFARIGVRAEVSADPRVVRDASHVVLPGVGAAATAMQRLAARGLSGLLRELSQPVLGICLGMQLLCEYSDEEDTGCLGIVPGRALKLAARAGQPVPHMGWNRIRRTGNDDLLHGVADGAHVYYVHSYALPVGEYTTAVSDYGQPLSACLRYRNFRGVQFHPERSATTGSRILSNFLEAG